MRKTRELRAYREVEEVGIKWMITLINMERYIYLITMGTGNSIQSKGQRWPL